MPAKYQVTDWAPADEELPILGGTISYDQWLMLEAHRWHAKDLSECWVERHHDQKHCIALFTNSSRMVVLEPEEQS